MFKYLGFILDTVQAQPETRDHFWLFFSIVLPAGISFYTFEIVSYSLDVADKKIEPERDLLRFTSFATFFPHLIAGPIMRYADLRQQLQALQTTQVLKPNIVSGLKLLSIGLVFKIFVADFSGTRVAKASDLPLDQLSGIDQFTQVAFWSSQIYYDFWAYSVMAIGLGRLFCIELPVNFREPYLSRDPREFWQRWHVTLSYWLRDYVYIRMGGRESYVRNILIVFALVGLWHGAGWNFVAWGLYHALLGHPVPRHCPGLGSTPAADRGRHDLHAGQLRLAAVLPEPGKICGVSWPSCDGGAVAHFALSCVRLALSGRDRSRHLWPSRARLALQ